MIRDFKLKLQIIEEEPIVLDSITFSKCLFIDLFVDGVHIKELLDDYGDSVIVFDELMDYVHIML